MSVVLPESLGHALSLLAAEPALTPIAGGTDLMVHWPLNAPAHSRAYLDLSALTELSFIRLSDSGLSLGAGTTYWETIRHAEVAAAFPLLVEAARQVGAVQIQTRGTWGGNIANASPAADGVPVLMAYDATVEIQSQRGTTTLPLSEFYLGYKEMRLEDDALITAIHIPRRGYDVQRFVKVGSRRAQAITKVGVAITRTRADGDGGEASRWRVVANSVAAYVCRCPNVEEFLQEGRVARGPEDLLPAIRADVSPIDDVRSTARYRERVLANVLYSELKDVS